MPSALASRRLGARHHVLLERTQPRRHRRALSGVHLADPLQRDRTGRLDGREGGRWQRRWRRGCQRRRRKPGKGRHTIGVVIGPRRGAVLDVSSSCVRTQPHAPCAVLEFRLLFVLLVLLIPRLARDGYYYWLRVVADARRSRGTWPSQHATRPCVTSAWRRSPAVLAVVERPEQTNRFRTVT